MYQRPDIMKLLEGNIGKILHNFGLRNDLFLHMTPEAQTARAKINKWDYIKQLFILNVLITF